MTWNRLIREVLAFRSRRPNHVVMSAEDIDRYLSSVDEPKRSTLEALRRMILEEFPDAEQGISYGMPAFSRSGKAVAGFAAFKNHCSYFPHSGSVIAQIPDAASYVTSKGALRFPVDAPPPKSLVKELIAVRLEELGLD